MLDLSVFEVLAVVLLYLAVPALVLFAVYWVTRLAVRHESRRSTAERVNQGPRPKTGVGARSDRTHRLSIVT